MIRTATLLRLQISEWTPMKRVEGRNIHQE
jgi:hypothetical protein